MKQTQQQLNPLQATKVTNVTKAAVHELETAKTNTPLLTFCKATADDLRLDILRVLSRDSFGVLELCRIFDCKQSGISHHLKILANAGLVVRRREGNSIFYRRALSHSARGLRSAAFAGLQKELYMAVEQQPLSPETEQRLSKIQKERADNAQSFFRDNAEKFRQHQEQVAAYELYAPNAIELIASSNIKFEETVMEVGPGNGEFLIELSKQFSKVIALDNSEKMLSIAKDLASSKKLTNISFINGDTKEAELINFDIDCVVINMVLHHVPSPAEMLYDIAKILAENGQLFITELCLHDQPWVKESCGDLWLGFDPVELGDWAKNAGFTEGESVYLAQRNGFRVQIRQFIKESESKIFESDSSS
ncbi:MAG: metalloregulator ArsR/SmtB family transcription factor [Gammaproteobacteria bacterium]|nr:metalloregulator ArsR/SmtB family transcription factor [Gammaproteobacteria bacterium]